MTPDHRKFMETIVAFLFMEIQNEIEPDLNENRICLISWANEFLTNQKAKVN